MLFCLQCSNRNYGRSETHEIVEIKQIIQTKLKAITKVMYFLLIKNTSFVDNNCSHLSEQKRVKLVYFIMCRSHLFCLSCVSHRGLSAWRLSAFLVSVRMSGNNNVSVEARDN